MTQLRGDRGSDSLTPAESERRQVTVLFSDIVGFTTMAEAMEEDDVYDLVRFLTSRQEKLIDRHGGVVQEFAGDGLLAVFGAPVAIEDAPIRACRAALDIQDFIRASQQDFFSRYGREVNLRIGIHSGSAIIGRMGDSTASASSVLGDTINTASRIQGLAEPGTVALSRATYDLVAPFIQATLRGTFALKGKSRPEEIFQLDGLRRGIARFDASRQKGLTTLIGRRDDLAQLLGHWQQASEGTPAILSVVGEAGIGKSRLIHEFIATLGKERCEILAGHCVSDAEMPYGPFIEIVTSAFNLRDDMSDAAVAADLANGAGRLGIDPVAIPYLLNLLGRRSDGEGSLQDNAPPEVVGVQTLRALLDLVACKCRGCPLLLVIEDLHWADDATLNVLSVLAGTDAPRRLMIVTSSRPGEAPGRAFGDKMATIELRPLLPAQVGELLRERFGGIQIPQALTDLLIARSDGNPLFCEELASYMQNRGFLRETGNAVTLSPAFDAADLPATVENLLMERVDHLPEGPRAVIRVASVVGRRFPATVVHEASGMSDRFADFLVTLLNQELVFAEQDNSFNDHIFKHALVQSAVYRTILRTQREDLHRRVAMILESRFGENAPELADALAYHFEKGGLPARALHYTAIAGRRALKLMSLNEAEHQLRHVLTYESTHPGTLSEAEFADVLIDFLHLMCWRNDFAEMLALADQHLPRIERGGESRQLSRVLQWQGEALICAGRFDEAAAALERAMQIGIAVGSDECQMFALWDQVWLCSVQPDVFPSDFIPQSCGRVLSYARTLNDYYHYASAWAMLAVDCLERGHLAEAAHWATESISFGRQTGYQPSISLGLCFLSLCKGLEGDPTEATSLHDESLSNAASEIEQAYGLVAKGSVLLLKGKFEEAREVLERLQQLALDKTFHVLLTAVTIPRAAAIALAGDVAGGLQALSEAIQMFGRWRNSRMIAWAYLISGTIQSHGAIAMAEDDPSRNSLAEQARASFRQAIQIGEKARTDGTVAQAWLALAELEDAFSNTEATRTAMAEARKIAPRLGWIALARQVEAASTA